MGVLEVDISWVPRKEPLPLAFAVLHHQPARIAHLRNQPLVLGRVVNTRKRIDHLVRHHRLVPERMMQLRHLRIIDRNRRLLAEPGEVMRNWKSIEICDCG